MSETAIERARRVKAEVEEDLLRLPGVTGIDTGPKIVGGKTTDDMAIRVYVERKGDVPEDQKIPSVIQGVPTDVIERRFVLHTSDTS